MGIVQDYFEKLPSLMKDDPEKFESINGVFQFTFIDEDDDESEYVLDCKEMKVYEGEDDEADCHLTMSEEDFGAILKKESNPMMLFSMGKLKVTGNLPLSLKLQEIF